MMKAKETLETAAGLVSGDRADAYGDMATCHQRIADLWQAYLSIRAEPAAPLDALDAAHMLALLKLARTQSGYRADNYVDLAGYAGVAGQIAGQTLGKMSQEAYDFYRSTGELPE